MEQPPAPIPRRSDRDVRRFGLALTLALATPGMMPAALASDLDAIRKAGVIRWGGDQEGGGPFIMPREDDPTKLHGFEVELADAIAAELGVRAEFKQSSWPQLPQLLERGDIDIVLNGYEATPERRQRMGSSIPYYRYALGLCVKRGGTFRGWADLKRPTGPGKPTVGVLEGSGADRYAQRELAGRCDIRQFDAVTNIMTAVENGQLDATIQDVPIIEYYVKREKRFPGLETVDEPVDPGYYVIYRRPEATELGAAMDAAIRKLHAGGKLKEIYDRYGIWDNAQAALDVAWRDWPPKDDSAATSNPRLMLWNRIPLFLQAAGTTVLLAAFAMPLACLIGTVIAVLRLQGDEKSPLPEFLPMPWPVRKLIHLLCDVWVELIRGTPLLFQLMVVYFILPQLGLRIDPFTSGVIALAINYSAYEAEIVRLGIQAIPRGQLEAALALGLSPWQATARIILPQAWRLVIPATANDFIALFKDTAVCSTISVMELSKQFNISYQSTQLIVESAALASALYLAMSYPLSIAARRLERWLKEER